MTSRPDCEIEIERLKNLLARREAQLSHAYDWRYEKELELLDLKQRFVEMKAELERLQREISTGLPNDLANDNLSLFSE